MEPTRVELLRTRLGQLDKLAVEILSDLFVDLEDRWLDQFEELIDHTNVNFEDETDEGIAQYEAEMERLEIKVMRRVGKALVNWSFHRPDKVLDRAQELAFGKSETRVPDNDDGEPAHHPEGGTK